MFLAGNFGLSFSEGNSLACCLTLRDPFTSNTLYPPCSYSQETVGKGSFYLIQQNKQNA